MYQKTFKHKIAEFLPGSVRIVAIWCRIAIAESSCGNVALARMAEESLLIKSRGFADKGRRRQEPELAAAKQGFLKKLGTDSRIGS